MRRYEDVRSYERLGLSRSTINNIILNVYGRVLAHLSIQIVRSKKLTILIDGTTDRKQRSPLAIQMTGIDPMNNNEHWFLFSFFVTSLSLSLVNNTHGILPFRSYPLSFCEPGDHTGITQCKVIVEMLDDISMLAGHTRKLTLLDIDAIVFDSTSSNTGLDKGLAGCILKRRKELYDVGHHEGDPPELIIHKCEDHVLNLISSDYEKVLIQNSPSVQVSSKHRATDVVQFIIAKVYFFIIIIVNNFFI
jgi:hypothetical protein